MSLHALAEYAAGATFGAALFASGVYSPAVITAQLRLNDFHMMKAFLTASAVSAIVTFTADRTRYAAMNVRNPRNLGFFAYDGNIIGGSMVGLGMALTGACPGTILVQAGIPVIQSGAYALLGCMLGGVFYVTLQPYLQRLQTVRHSQRLSNSTPEHTVFFTASQGASPTIHATLNLSPFTVLVAWEVACLVMLRLISLYNPSQKQPQLAGLITPVFGGLILGAAQGAVILLTRHAVGCSAAFEVIGRYLSSTATSSKHALSAMHHLLEPATLFSAGVVSAGAIGSAYSPTIPTTSIGDHSALATAVVGGAVMAFGARLAGGCTSGHGISGLATFSFASFVSVAAMFGAGITTATLFS